MKKIIFLPLFFVFFCFSCSSSTKNLDAKLIELQKAYKDLDYVKMVSFTHPSVVKDLGGTEKATESLQSINEEALRMGFDMSKIKLGKVGKIQETDNFLIAIVPTTLNFKIKNIDGVVKGSIICLSENQGENWFFMEGNDSGRTAISKISPGLIQSLDIPIPEMIWNGKTLVQKGGRWVEKH